jgi:hypothetical protein
VIARSVTNSVRSHYDRRDIESLFELQPRAAQKLLELLPTVRIGNSCLVDREVLAGFLDRVRNADNTGKLFDEIRAEKAQVSRRKPRSLVRRDLDPIGIGSLPTSITLEPGRMEVRFETVEQLAEAMYALARVLENEGDQFVLAFEHRSAKLKANEEGEMRQMLADLEHL